LAVLAATSLTCAAARADVIHVPRDYPTIQAGIDAAMDGDEVVVADGVYTGEGNKNLDFNGKAITVRSENGPDTCIIDCEGDGRGFVFQSGETGASVVKGFTITGGGGERYGGGVYCNDSSPSILECRITANSADWHGGGVYWQSGSATLGNCTISGNTSGMRGGGVWFSETAAELTRCIITANSAVTSSGGGIYLNESQAILAACAISGNTAGGNGGGICCRSGPMTINNTMISRNQADGNGGGLSCQNNLLISVTNCLILSNQADQGGAAFFVSNVRFDHCTISGNYSREAPGGIYFGNNSNQTILNSILWDNSPKEIKVEGGNLDVRFSDVKGGWPGEGNIDADPLFVPGPLGEFYLSQTAAGQPGDSPCVNAGTGPAEYWGRDSQTTRTDQAGDTGIGDMGYHYALPPLLVPRDYPTIQAAIDAAREGDTVLVADGTYTGKGNKDLDFRGKAIAVRCENGPDSCAIDCEDDGRGFMFHSGETARSVVDGFTIRNGRIEGEIGGGAIACTDGSSPTITNCMLTDNTAPRGGGIYCGANSNPTIADCVLSANTATDGGGGIFTVSSSPTITGCRFNDNTARFGGGLSLELNSNGTVVGCTITGNRADTGGGMQCTGSDPLISNCLIGANNATSRGGGIYFDHSDGPVINNCTIVGNTADAEGGGFHVSDSALTITNSILWNDTPQEISVSEGSVTVTYSDVQGGWPGEGNLDADPRFVSGPHGEFYLSQVAAGQPLDSPCMDAGSDRAPVLDLASITTRTDEKGDRDTADMGYHFPIGDGGRTIRVPRDQATIQAAIMSASDTDVIVVADGVYTGTGNYNVYFSGKAITVRSQNGPEKCTIDCEEKGGGFHFEHDETPASILDGFTITNGKTKRGGGIYCSGASPTIRNCVITGNTAFDVAFSRGGGIYCVENSNPTITRCTITDNKAVNGSGGGVYCCVNSNPAFVDCLIGGNRTDGSGGGLYCNLGVKPTFTNCSFIGNSAYYSGGGISSRGFPTFTNCAIADNTSEYRGGGVGNTAGRFINCTITGNYAERWGGGIFCEAPGPTLVNCVITGNTAGGDGGGIVSNDGCVPIITNSVFWGNTPGEIRRTSKGGEPRVSYSDVQGGWPGDGNIDDEPMFVDPNNGDYHLTDGSPCVDAGDNEAPSLPKYDFEGEQRIQQCRVEMGVDETPYFKDCNNNGKSDACDIAEGRSRDLNNNGIPDECEEHCSGNESLRVKCKNRRRGNTLSARLRHGLPDAPVTFRLDGDPERDIYRTVDDHGKARVKYEYVAPGPHTVEVVECGVRAEVNCP